ncbi:hypothetical protein NYR55_12380 [Sphingomonas sp. BGYR3]|uniref:hypothetical protein n=1 Tax=Sphingomonas sp. BGYR3 TaxID=2975483 RepID=UPI0021A29158|nr:hypothetical protein [Sphingomonas sp. BGYR3]MDG5489412.1 hypothetical protein [Sphingomonas sp. BGYR3]
MDVGRILGAGFRLVQAQPFAVAIWVIINIALAAISQFGMASMFGSILSAGNPGADPMAVFSGVGTLYAVQFGVMIVQLLIWAAAYRAVFYPGNSAFAFLRLGADEGRLLLLGIVTALISGALMIGIFLPLGITAGIAGASGGSPGPGAVLLTFGAMLLAFVAFIFIGVRLALAWPMVVADRRIALGEAWRLSKGRFWPMFGAALVLAIGLSVAGQIVSAIQFGGLMTALVPGSDPQQMQNLLIERFSSITVVSVIAWILGGIVSTAWIVSMAAGISDALVQVKPDDHDDLAEIYA